VAAIADLLSERNRRRLLERLAELEQLDTLVRERGQQQAPGPPPTLAEISTTTERNGS
jgi:hypothetical protein